MFKLSDTPSKEEYKTHDGQEVMLGDLKVKVVLDRVSTKSGSYARGFKFGSITYGLLERAVKPSKKTMWYPSEFSCDHGVSWHPTVTQAKKVKGKVIVDKPAPRGEFAFDRIQELNRQYEGPSYKWKP